MSPCLASNPRALRANIKAVLCLAILSFIPCSAQDAQQPADQIDLLLSQRVDFVSQLHAILENPKAPDDAKLKAIKAALGQLDMDTKMLSADQRMIKAEEAKFKAVVGLQQTTKKLNQSDGDLNGYRPQGSPPPSHN